jgi:hypothetical protein
VEKNASKAALSRSTTRPAHRLNHPKPATQFREILCCVGDPRSVWKITPSITVRPPRTTVAILIADLS